MESKYTLNLCANYVSEDLKSAVVNCLLYDYIVDELRQTIKRFHNGDIDLFYVLESFKNAIDKGNSVTFATLKDWERNKISAYTDCLNIVNTLDELASNAGKIKQGELIEEFRRKTQDFVVSLATCDIDIEHIDFGNLNIKQDFVKNMLHELSLVDEGQFLSDLSNMQFKMVPLEINKYRNKFIEQKLNRAKNIAVSVDNLLEKDFEDLHNDIMKSYDKFYKIAYAVLSDGEKADSARNVIKCIPPHRRVLDKLENKLTEANELKRQLAIREKKLKSDLVNQLQEVAKLKEKNSYEQEKLDREAESLKFVTEKYLTQISLVISLINRIEQDISERYKMLDRVEIALKGAIPSESELKRYSSLNFKFEDLYVRLELAKSQIKDKGKDFNIAINTAIAGLGVLNSLSLEGKDVFVRNSLLSAVFNSVNGIYDLVDNQNQSVELTQIKFVTTRLVQYSLLNNTFVKDLQTFRHICNNTIRDIAIMMGKPFNLNTMLDITDTIDLSIKQVQEIVDTLNKNHTEQTRLIGDILNV
ncbi:MAG: hypothetical protein ACI4PF_01515 [Christensenellales bacterium]